MCETCNQSFKSRDKLKHHIENVHATRDMDCDECDKKFKTKQKMANHRSRMHNKTSERVECEKCEHIAVNKHALWNHVKYQHSDISWHACDQCDFRTKMRSNLQNHVRSTHSEGVRNFVCSVCSKSFKTAGTLSQHRMTHLAAESKLKLQIVLDDE